jgi:hypothetical protein
MAALLRKLGFAERGAAPGGGRAAKPVQPPLTNQEAVAVRKVPSDIDKVIPHAGTRAAPRMPRRRVRVAVCRSVARRRALLKHARTNASRAPPHQGCRASTRR